MLEKDHFAYISLIEGMTKSVDKRICNMDEVLETLAASTKKYLKNNKINTSEYITERIVI